MLFRFQVVFQLSLFLKSFPTYLTEEFLNVYSLYVASSNSFFLLLGVLSSSFFSINSKLFSVSLPLFFLFLLLLPPFLFFLLLPGKWELFETRVFILKFFDQLSHHFIEEVPFFSAFFFILIFNQSLDSTIWRVFRIVGISVSKLLRSREMLPILVESKHDLGCWEVITKRHGLMMLSADLLL